MGRGHGDSRGPWGAQSWSIGVCGVAASLWVAGTDVALSEYTHPAQTEQTLRDSVPRTSSPPPRAPPAPHGHRTPGRPHSSSIEFPPRGGSPSSVPPGKDARQLTGTLFKAHTSRPSVESPGPSQTGQGDKASLNRTPPSSSGTAIPSAATGRLDARARIQTEPTWRRRPAGRMRSTRLGEVMGGGAREPRAEFRGQRALRGVRSQSLGGGGVSPLSSL